MKENMNEPLGTMPHVGAMQHAQAMPSALPAQPNPSGVMPASMNAKPSQMNPSAVMPAMMNQMPMQPNPSAVMPAMMNPMMNAMPMMCCPYLMNMQCPMPYASNVLGMNMMNNPMNNPMLMPGNMGMNPYYPMGGM